MATPLTCLAECFLRHRLAAYGRILFGEAAPRVPESVIGEHT